MLSVVEFVEAPNKMIVVLLCFRNQKPTIMKTTFNALINSKQPVLIDFSAQWCGPCQMQSKILEGLVKNFKGRIKIVKIDVDENQEIALKQKVYSIPTLVLFRNGNVIWRKTGLSQRDELLELLKK